ncbi:RNA-binding S4 domain-containing protein [Allonocardiopsis opalescens]|uniref:RNA-binding S4 domain-containing protein n=1 Tax=Allonocardiopsis opalescens TaxID=1144618 RepID=UPI001FEBBFF8|nr:S4 domain-containing protein [Allonocardiopsis opalescens]
MDRWLWAVRLVKTRSDAVQACRGGHVRIDGRPAKAAAAVRAGAVVRVHLPGGTRIVEVVHIIEKRTSAPIAVQCYIDRTPPPPPEQHGSVPRRDRGAGRPTKRDRRRLDRLRRGES